jgi:hypothetical protein
MGLNLSAGSVSTAAANATLHWTIRFANEEYVGPVNTCANFAPGKAIFEPNFGSITTVQTSVSAFFKVLFGTLGTGFKYDSVLRNDGSSPVAYNLSVGWFS